MAGLSEELRALAAQERDALAVLALAYSPVSLAEWTQLLARTDVDTTAETMSRLCERAVRKGLLEEQVGRDRRLYATTAEQALEHLEDAQHRGRLRVLDRAVRDLRDRGGARRYSGAARGWDVAGSALRVALVRGDRDAVTEALGALPREASTEDRGAFLAMTLGTRPPEAWLDRLGTDGGLYLETLARGAVELLWPLGDEALARAEASPGTRTLAAQLHAMQGRDEAALAEGRIPARDRFEIALVTAFWAGRREQAWEIGNDARETLGKRGARGLRGLAGVVHAITRLLVAQDRPAEWEALGRVVEEHEDPRADHRSAYRCLGIIQHAATSSARPDLDRLHHASGPTGVLAEDGWIGALVAGLVHAWLDVTPDRGLRQSLEGWRDRARDHGYAPVAQELDVLLGALDGIEPPAGSLAAGYRPRQAWEIALDSLEAIAKAPEQAAAPKSRTRRILWEVALLEETVEIRPRLLEGARAKRGRPITVARLLDDDVDWLSEADERVLSHVEYEEPSAFSRRHTRKATLGARALLGLVDHPAVIEPDGSPLSITRGEPGLRVRSTAAGLRLTVHPDAMRDAALAWVEQSPGHLVVYERTEAIERVARVLSRGRVEIPERGRDRLGEVLSRLGERLPVDASGEVPIEAEEREADPRPVVLLERAGTRLSARLRVAPLGLGGPKLRAGAGDARVTSIVEGRARSAERDLPDEVARREALLDDCPTLAALGGERDERRTDDLGEALEVMLELSRLGDEAVVAWPRGQGLPTPTVVGSGALRVRVKRAREWLTVDAHLPVDEDRVLEFRELLELPREGRFVKLDGDRFLALTRELAEQLDALEGIGTPTKRGLKVSPALLPLLDELTRDAGEQTLDAPSRARLEELLSIGDRHHEIPRAFAGELRDYQRDGFQWMMRLADAELGACLADDMGLGKTVQALALLVAKGGEGPSLVVAPASVASNWVDEARRFAPTLRFVSLRDANRAEAVSSLGPRDVLVCSYGLLVSEAERLAEVPFYAVVLDEAHYLKNPRTKRARSAHALSARFRLALTGTPIENHLGEVWSLMRATLPGLLGSKKRFEARYGTLRRDGDRERAAQLKSVLRPFLLRRTKAQVLDELPPRTEVTLRVTPTTEERAFYEALRRRAIERLAVPDSASRMQVLAEIMRLRQAAIDPRLVDADEGPPGAKIDALIDRLLSLREEGHRALVFSQFLGSLARVGERLEEAGVSYLVLEGATPAKERARRIAAFQEGTVDVFLMSLKAGGVGVNLTAADFVIHLDPWWNPAVEDQATGRAHRIGQRRPVTVYRLITEGTIEEKILALHRDKRALAEDLLSGMEESRGLDLDELRALLEP